MQIQHSEIFQNLKENQERSRNDHILLIDGLNMLLRSFAVVNTINSAGNHTGGVTGFLKSVGSVVRQFNPTRVIIVWDGKGGSQSRKMIDSNYKAQREHASVIHWDMFDNKKEEMQSVWDQAERLADYLECLPITVIGLDRLEADDIVAYLARYASYKGHKVTVVSSDKDFLQLIDDNIQVYSPVKKVLYDREEAFSFLGVLPENYNIVKALLGDKSDNLRGIKGAGIKTLTKLFPGLVDNPDYSLDLLYEECGQNLGTKKLYAVIVNEWNVVEKNFKLMNLNKTVLDNNEKNTVLSAVNRPVPNLRVGPFLHYLEQDYIEGLAKNVEEWLNVFRYLQNF